MAEYRTRTGYSDVDPFTRRQAVAGLLETTRTAKDRLAQELKVATELKPKADDILERYHSAKTMEQRRAIGNEWRALALDSLGRGGATRNNWRNWTPSNRMPYL